MDSSAAVNQNWKKPQRNTGGTLAAVTLYEKTGEAHAERRLSNTVTPYSHLDTWKAGADLYPPQFFFNTIFYAFLCCQSDLAENLI